MAVLNFFQTASVLTKNGSVYFKFKWSKIRRGISQGSVLGSLLFNIFIDSIFITIEQSGICNFTDDNTLKVNRNMIFDTKSILNWFRLNFLNANPGKFHFMFLGDTFHRKHISKINLIDEVLLLGITTDKK